MARQILLRFSQKKTMSVEQINGSLVLGKQGCQMLSEEGSKKLYCDLE